MINCIVIDDEKVARDVLENHLSSLNSIKILASCKNVPEALEVMNINKVDLIFLDIDLPEISGLTLAKSITKNIKIIFTTAHREFAVEGFELKAVDYLLKPISFERLLQAVNKFFDESISVVFPAEENIHTEKHDYFFVRADRKMVKINLSNILFIESMGDYLKIHLVDKIVVTRETITNIEAKLPVQSFIKVHRSFIVSLIYIDSYTNEDIHIGNKEIPISRSYKKEVLETLVKS